MDASVAHHLDSGSDRRFVTEADWIPGFWNYFLDLNRYDLIAELIQNDLDQDAECTVISFEEDRLVYKGSGSAGSRIIQSLALRTKGQRNRPSRTCNAGSNYE